MPETGSEQARGDLDGLVPQRDPLRLRSQVIAHTAQDERES